MRNQTPDELSYKQFNFADGTIIVGHVGGCLTKDQIINGCNAGYGVQFPPLYNELISRGYADNEIEKCSVSIIEHSAHWHNAHSGFDGSFGTKWAYANKNVLPLLVEGEIVEIEIKGGVGEIVRIRHAKNEMKDFCTMERHKKNPLAEFLDAIHPAGGTGSLSLVCTDLNADEWQRRYFGMYNEFLLVKTSPSN